MNFLTLYTRCLSSNSKNKNEDYLTFTLTTPDATGEAGPEGRKNCANAERIVSSVGKRDGIKRVRLSQVRATSNLFKRLTI